MSEAKRNEVPLDRIVGRLERLRAERQARRAADWALVQEQAPEVAEFLRACRATFGPDARAVRLVVQGRRIV